MDTPLCFDQALLYGQFCCQPLSTFTKIVESYITGGWGQNGTVSVTETNIQKGRGLLNQPQTYKLDVSE